jgi:preprotein translocase subunit SecA
LFGRSGRQGDPGTTQAIISLHDPLFADLPAWLRSAVALTRGALQRFWLRRLVRHAQARAERRAFKLRMQTLRQDRELHRLIGFAGPNT